MSLFWTVNCLMPWIGCCALDVFLPTYAYYYFLNKMYEEGKCAEM